MEIIGPGAAASDPPEGTSSWTGELSSRVAHRLNNCMTAIHVSADQLNNVSKLDAASRGSAQRILSICEQVTELSRFLLPLGLQSPDSHRIRQDLVGVLREFEASIRQLIAPSTNIELRIEFPSEQGLAVGARLMAKIMPVELYSQLLELTRPAWTVSAPPGSLSVLLSTSRGSQWEGGDSQGLRCIGTVVVDWRPEGDASISSDAGGVSRRWAELTEATASFERLESSPGHVVARRGFELELRRPTGDGESAPGSLPDWASTVLLVEDDRQVRAVLASILESMGCVVVQAGGALAALDALRALLQGGGTGELKRQGERASGAHLAVIDHELPEMKAPELIAKLRSLQSGLRILVLSGLPGAASSVRKAGVQGFLQKPFRVSVLRDLVRKCLFEEESGGQESTASGTDRRGRGS